MEMTVSEMKELAETMRPECNPEIDLSEVWYWIGHKCDMGNFSQKIRAIKAYRRLVGVGLHESKAAVELMMVQSEKFSY